MAFPSLIIHAGSFGRVELSNVASAMVTLFLFAN